MSLLLCFCTGVAAGPGPGQLEEPASQQRPNLVIAMADDLGFSDVGWKTPNLITPHLDALARAGVVLDRHYVFM